MTSDRALGVDPAARPGRRHLRRGDLLFVAAVRGRRRHVAGTGPTTSDPAGGRRRGPGRGRLPARRRDDGLPIARAEATKNGYTSGVNGYTVTPVQDPRQPASAQGQHQRPDRHVLRPRRSASTNFLAHPRLQGRLRPARADGQPAELLRRRLLREGRDHDGHRRHTGWLDAASTPAANSDEPRATPTVPMAHRDGDVATRNNTMQPVPAVDGGFDASLPSRLHRVDHRVSIVRIAARARATPAACTARAALDWNGPRGRRRRQHGRRRHPIDDLTAACQTDHRRLRRATYWGRTWTAAERRQREPPGPAAGL